MSSVGTKDREGEKQLRVVDEQVRDYLDKLEVIKSAGPDGIHLKAWKKVVEVILKPLANLLRTHRVIR